LRVSNASSSSANESTEEEELIRQDISLIFQIQKTCGFLTARC